MADPFLITGPAVISVSGGRTSGYMLWRILQAHGGTLPEDVVIAFANTGREMPGTLDFVRDIAAFWNVRIEWLEFRRDTDTGRRWSEEVSHNSASRQGEPFAAMLAIKASLPNPVRRFCTTELKVRVVERWVRATLGWKRWVNVVGLRADEPKRIKRLHIRNADAKNRWTSLAPLADAGIVKADVMAFWAAQPFDLRLAGEWEGNCDGCFLKRRAAIARMFRDHPERMAWWVEQERHAREKAIAAGAKMKPTASMFRQDRPPFAAIRDAEISQARMNLAQDDNGIDAMFADSCDSGCGI